MAKKEKLNLKESAIEDIQNAIQKLEQVYQENPTNPIYTVLVNLELTIPEIKK
jgi:hypothetical protein